MRASKDLKSLSSYMLSSGKSIISETGKRRFFIPFFRDKIPELFNKSVVMSSVYLNLTSFSDPKSYSTNIGYIYSFKGKSAIKALPAPANDAFLNFKEIPNTTMACLIEHSTGVNANNITLQCKNVFKGMDIKNASELRSSFNSTEIQNILNENCIPNTEELKTNKFSGNGGFISYGKI